MHNNRDKEGQVKGQELFLVGVQGKIPQDIKNEKWKKVRQGTQGNTGQTPVLHRIKHLRT